MFYWTSVLDLRLLPPTIPLLESPLHIINLKHLHDIVTSLKQYTPSIIVHVYTPSNFIWCLSIFFHYSLHVNVRGLGCHLFCTGTTNGPWRSLTSHDLASHQPIVVSQTKRWAGDCCYTYFGESSCIMYNRRHVLWILYYQSNKSFVSFSLPSNLIHPRRLRNIYLHQLTSTLITTCILNKHYYGSNIVTPSYQTTSSSTSHVQLSWINSKVCH